MGLICNGEHSPHVCADPYCYTMQTEIMGKTINAAYNELIRDMYIPDPMRLAHGVRDMLAKADRMATQSTQKVNRQSYMVSEQHIVLNLPPNLAYRNSDAGEGLVFEWERP